MINKYDRYTYIYADINTLIYIYIYIYIYKCFYKYQVHH